MADIPRFPTVNARQVIENYIALQKVKQAQEEMARQQRMTDAGMIAPGEVRGISREVTPSVAGVLLPKAIAPKKIGEGVEGGKKYATFLTDTGLEKYPLGEATTGVQGKSKQLPASLLGQLSKAAQSEGFIDEIKRMEKLLPQSTGPGGLVERGVLRVQQATGGLLGGDPKIIAYEQMRQTAARKLYKELSGDVGNIAQNEASFAVDLIPTAYEAPAVRSEKIARLDRMKQKMRIVVDALQKMYDAGRIDTNEFTRLVKEATLDTMSQGWSDLNPGKTIPVTSEQPSELAPESFEILSEEPE